MSTGSAEAPVVSEELTQNSSSSNQVESSWMAYLSSSYVFDAVKLILVAYLIFALVRAYLNRGKIKPRFGTNHRDRISKRFYYSQYDFLRDLDQEEAALMNTTFENTVKNASAIPTIQLSKEDSKGKIKQKRVSFHAEIKEK